MNSYQKLKQNIESLKLEIYRLEKELHLFKNVLTFVDCPKVIRDENKNIITFESRYVCMATKILDEAAKKELTRWVATNLDKTSVMALLSLREKYDNKTC